VRGEKLENHQEFDASRLSLLPAPSSDLEMAHKITR
jgi:hypothetical protein